MKMPSRIFVSVMAFLGTEDGWAACSAATGLALLIVLGLALG